MDWKGFFGLGFHQIDFTPKYYPPERERAHFEIT